METRLAPVRVNNLDIVKLVCAFLVVCIHVLFQGSTGEYVAAVGGIAVPIFLMITGYFTSPIAGEMKREKKQLCKILMLILVANALYFAWDLFISVISPASSPVMYLKETFTMHNMANFVVLNESPFEIHLWYLTAVLFALIIINGLKRIGIRKVYWLIPVLLVCNVVLSSYSGMLFNKELYYLYARNFLFDGVPWVLLGMLIAEKKEKLASFFRCKAMPFVLVVLTGAVVLERYLLKTYDLYSGGGRFISSILLSLCLFMFAISAKDVSKDNIFAKLGRENATFIYIMHMIVKDVLAIAVPKVLPFAVDLYEMVRPVVVFAATLVLSILFNWVKKRIFSKKSSKIAQQPVVDAT